MFRKESLRDYLEAQMPAALKMLQQMVGINSFTRNIEGVNRLGKLTADCFSPLGFQAEFVPSTNPLFGSHLAMTRPGKTQRSIAMISHLDTVFPPEEEERNHFQWSVEGDRIYGPGTQDIKGGTVMMWLVLKTLQQQAPDVFGDIAWKLFWNSSEEQFSPDFGQVCRDRFDPKTLGALVFEAEGRREGTGLLVLARKGRASWRVTVEGRAAHAGGKHAHGANALVQAAKMAIRISEMTDYSRDLTFNPATLHAGTVLNRVPHEAILEGEMRAFAPGPYTDGLTGLRRLSSLADVRSTADGHPCAVKVDILTESRPWPRNRGTDDLFAHFVRASESVGVPIGSEERGGLSDGNLIWDVVPTIDGLGPWGDNDHCSERSSDGSKVPEYVEVSSFVPKAMLNVAAITRIAQQGQ